MKHFLLFILCLTPAALFAHEGHVHAEAPGAGSGDIGGIIHVTEQGKLNLGIEVAEAEIVEIEKTLEAVVEIVPVPTQMAVLSSRIPGKVVEISATAGETVEANKPLVVIESLQAGNPPPKVSYPAPISGVVTHWDAAVGESVEPNGHLAEIVDLSEVYAEITLFEGQLSQVQLGQPVRVRVESFPGEVFEGQIDLMSGKLDPVTRALKVFVKLDNPDLRLRPHMRGTGHVVVEQLEAVIGIPHRAVVGDPGNLSVFVQSDNEGLEYEQRPVVIGAEDDRFIEIIEGVLPAEEVVVSGNYQLQFVENKAAIPAGGGHGHDHGPGGEHLAEADAVAHGEDAHQHSAHGHSHGDHGHSHGPSIPRWLTSPLGLGLCAALLLSLGLNGFLIFKREPA
ncbi:MAG: efflux RND transporter periplasmic adaptor subunit [Verrucomicrobiota bacterium]